MEHGTNTAFVGVQLGRALGVGAEDLEAVFYGALVKDAGCGACGAVLARFFADDELIPRLDLNLVDLHSPRSMAAWAVSRLRLDPGMPARLVRLAAFASRCGSVVHEAMAVHCEVAADFAAGLGFGPHVRDAVHYQYERHDGRSPGFGFFAGQRIGYGPDSRRLGTRWWPGGMFRTCSCGRSRTGAMRLRGRSRAA